VSVAIGGINTISRALISKVSGSNNHIIYAEGIGLREVLRVQGVDSRSSFSNHILEIEENLGIEGARNSIINQVT
jgi:DNA-directed RNA polymerase beta' subunit